MEQSAKIQEQSSGCRDPRVTSIDMIPWEDLVFTLRDHEIRILQLVYLPGPQPILYKRIYAALAGINYSKRTARRQIARLRGLGLIHTVQSVIGIANPVLEIAGNVKTLLDLTEKRRHRAGDNPVYAEIAKRLLDTRQKVKDAK